MSFKHIMDARSKRAAGFTMVELLLVIAIIVLLISIFMPGLRRAISGAKRVSCGANMHQLQIALASYVDDHGGIFPSKEDEWALCLHPYLGGAEDGDRPLPVFRCPAHSAPLVHGRYHTCSYSIIAAFQNTNHPDQPRRLATLRHPYDVPVITEVASWITDQRGNPAMNVAFAGDDPRLAWQIDPNSNGVQLAWPESRNETLLVHDGKVHYIMADGHVELIDLYGERLPVLWLEAIRVNHPNYRRN